MVAPTLKTMRGLEEQDPGQTNDEQEGIVNGGCGSYICSQFQIGLDAGGMDALPYISGPRLASQRAKRKLRTISADTLVSEVRGDLDMPSPELTSCAILTLTIELFVLQGTA